MILGHLTVTYVAAKQLEKVYPFLARTPLLIIGAYLPDLADKPLAIVFGVPGRGIFHSAVVISLLFLALVIAFPRRRDAILAVGAGALLHILEDLAPPVYIFWPLLGEWPTVPSVGLLEKLSNYYLYFKSPFQFTLELLSYPFFIWMVMKRKWSRQRLNAAEENASQ